MQYEVNGLDKSKLILYDHKIVIYPAKTPFAKQRIVEIYLNQITGVQLRKPGLTKLSKGYIKILGAGLSPNNDAISFSKIKDYKDALVIKEKIDNLLSTKN